MIELRHDKWRGDTYGNKWMHKWLIKLLRVINVRVVYAFTFLFIIPPTIIIKYKESKSIFDFYKSGFNYNFIKASWLTYMNFCSFSQVIIDRFAMYSGKKFNISKSGYEEFQKLDESNSGFIPFTAHIGNYELAGYSLISQNKRFNVLVSGLEKENIMANRVQMLDCNNIRMISMSSDMGYLFTIDKALNDGEIVSIAADRVFGSNKSFEIKFLGNMTKFPQGPFILAAMKKVPVIFVSVMKTGCKSYHTYIKTMEWDFNIPVKEAALKIAEQYVALLQDIIKKHPSQWYNYFNIWTN